MDLYSIGPLRLQPDGVLLRGERPVDLPPKQRALLDLLARSAGRLVSKSEILEHLWPDADVSEASVTTCVRGLRLALGDRRRRGGLLETVQGRGYRLHARREREASDSTRARAERIRVAVAPFAGRGDARRYLAEGLAGELSAGLDRWRADRIEAIARLSARRAWQPRADPIALGRALDADFVVTGRVESSRREVRVRVRLLRVSTRTVEWSGGFSAPADLTRRLSGEIAAALAKRLIEGSGAPFTPRSVPALSTDPRAYRAVLRGLFLNQLRDEVGLRRSLAFFEHALAWDPRCVAACVGLAESHLSLGWRGYAAPLAIAEAVRRALDRALEIDPRAELAHAGRAFLAMLVDRDPRAADAALALASDPDASNDRSAWMQAIVSIARGRFTDALRVLDAALAVDPLSPNLSIARGLALWFSARGEEALDAARALADAEPAFAAAHALRANVATMLGLHDEALRAAERGDALAQGDQLTRSACAWTFAQVGRPDAARAILHAFERRAEARYVSPSYVAIGYGGLGDLDGARRWLARAARSRCMWFPLAAVDPRFAGLRADPGCAAILAAGRDARSSPPRADRTRALANAR
jgi:DNA-binding winged helix-turn-helix (wHTH) protein/tetratricopeptide (TPR) repeat protein